MRLAIKYLELVSILCMITLYTNSLSGQQIDFSFDTKDYNGVVMPLNERLDDDKNYLVLFSAFWCLPCVKQIDDVFSQNIDQYRDIYNLEVIVLNDDYYNETNIAKNKMREKQWYFHQYMTDDIFGSLGVNSIPRDYLILAGESTGERVYTSNFLSVLEAEYVESGYESIFFSENIQHLRTEDCAVTSYTYGVLNSETINAQLYHNVDGNYFRSGILNNNIYRYNMLSDQEELVFDYSLGQCDEFTLKDHEGDALQITVESRSVVDGEIIIETDQMIESDCGEEIPFVMSSIYGSNAGLLFDIEQNEITSRLVCQTTNQESVYIDDELADLCLPLDIEELEIENSIRLTNNPGNGLFEVIGNTNLPIRVHDIYGNLIENPQNQNAVDLSKSANGPYIVIVGNTNRLYIKNGHQ